MEDLWDIFDAKAAKGFPINQKEGEKRNVEGTTHLELLLALTFLFETHPFLVFLVVTPLGRL